MPTSEALDRAREAAKSAPDVKVREEKGLLVYSSRGKDLLMRRLDNPGVYVLLCDVPATEGKKGQTRQLCEPFDEQCACTCREIAAGIG